MSLNGKAAPNGKSAHPPRPPLLTRLLRILLPCIASSDKSHPVEPRPPPAKPPPPAVQDGKPKEVVPEPEPEPKPEQQDLPVANDVAESVLDETGLSPAPLPPPVDIPSATADVIVPPTPTKTLPVAETEGVTSGAVVPPGSSGTIHEKHPPASSVPSNASTEGDDSDFTDDEIDDLADDDPDELILLNGGAGIPVGPVSTRLISFSLAL
jgi:RNA polymerase II subunit A small phosphatase-like protein